MFIKMLKIDGLHDRAFIAADEGPVVLRNLANLIYPFYFSRNYPRFLSLPSVVLNAFETLFSVTHNTNS